MDEDEGYGKCDEMGTGGSCKACTAHPVPGEGRVFNQLDPTGEAKTQPVRVWMTDLDVLRSLKVNDDETPGTVIHRVLIEHNASKHDKPGAAQQCIDQLNIIIGNQKEEIKTLRREIAELGVTIEDLKGDSLINAIDEDHEPETRKIYDENGVTVNIIINRGSE